LNGDGSNSCHALATFSHGSVAWLGGILYRVTQPTERRKGNFGLGRRREADAQQQVLKIWVRSQGADAGIQLPGWWLSFRLPDSPSKWHGQKWQWVGRH